MSEDMNELKRQIAVKLTENARRTIQGYLESMAAIAINMSAVEKTADCPLNSGTVELALVAFFETLGELTEKMDLGISMRAVVPVTESIPKDKLN